MQLVGSADQKSEKTSSSEHYKGSTHSAPQLQRDELRLNDVEQDNTQAYESVKGILDEEDFWTLATPEH